MLNTIDEVSNPADPSSWVPLPGSGREVEDAEAALEGARDDLDGYLADTTLRWTLRPERYNEAVSDYVAAANAAEAALAEARERTGGGFELVGRLWNADWGWAERPRVGRADGQRRRRVAGPRAAEPPRRGRASLEAHSESLPDEGEGDKRRSAPTAAPVEGKLRTPDYRAGRRMRACRRRTVRMPFLACLALGPRASSFTMRAGRGAPPNRAQRLYGVQPVLEPEPALLEGPPVSPRTTWRAELSFHLSRSGGMLTSKGLGKPFAPRLCDRRCSSPRFLSTAFHCGIGLYSVEHVSGRGWRGEAGPLSSTSALGLARGARGELLEREVHDRRGVPPCLRTHRGEDGRRGR